MAAISKQELENASVDAQSLSLVANGDENSTVVTRLGKIYPTLARWFKDLSVKASTVLAQNGYAVPVAYTGGINLTTPNQTVSYNGVVYAPIQNQLPFTTSGTFETVKFRVIQGVASTDLSAPTGSNLSGFVQTGLGATPMTVLEKLRQRYTLADYYQTSDGASAMSNAITRIMNEAPRQTVELDIGDYDWTLNSDFTIPSGKRLLVQGHGQINFAGGSLIRNTHDKHTALHGIKAIGNYPALKFALTPAASSYKEFDITAVEFMMSPNVWALSFDGAREGSIERCNFKSGRGIYRTKSNIVYISKSFFIGLGFAIFDEGLGSGFSCGMSLSQVEILGCNRSLVVSQTDDGGLYECTIDYNDEGIYLLGQDRYKIFGGYIGTRTAEAATPNVAIGGCTPAINIIGTASVRCEKIKIIGAVLTGHHEINNQYDNIYMEYANYVSISDTDFSFWTRNGLRYGPSITEFNIHDCDFANRGGTGTYSIECISTDDSSNKIHDNVLAMNKGIIAPFANIRSNVRFLTAQQGEAVTTGGVSSHVVTFPTPLAFNPIKSDVTLTASNNIAILAGPFISAISSTQLTIGFNSPTTGACGIVWKIAKNQLAG